MLEKFVKNLYDLLKPGGKLIGLNANFKITPEEYKSLEKYRDYIKVEKQPLEEGDKIICNCQEDINNPPIDVVVYYMKPETYEKSFAKFGFNDFKWIPFIMAEDV